MSAPVMPWLPLLLAALAGGLLLHSLIPRLQQQLLDQPNPVVLISCPRRAAEASPLC